MKRELTYSGMGPMEVLPVELGGTGQSADKDTINDFNMLTIPELNALDGVLAYRQDGTIDSAMIPEEVFAVTPFHLEYEAEYQTNTAVVLSITDFDAWTNYVIMATFNGQALTTTFDAEVGQIALTTPGTPGVVTLVINNRMYYLKVVQSVVKVVKPTITSPVAGSTNVNRTFQLTGTAIALSNNGVALHDRSDWQIALDANFTQVVFQSINDAINKTSVEGVLTQPNTVYYARVRYHDAVYGLSPWSDTVTFRSRSSFAISIETAKLLGSDGTAGDYLGESGFGYSPQGIFNTIAVNDAGNIIAASIRRIGSNGNSQGGLFIWRKQSGSWNEIKKILSSTSTQAQTMVLTIPSGGSITVNIQGTSPSTTTYTSSQSITIPAGSTSVVLTGKGQDGTTIVSGTSVRYRTSVSTLNFESNDSITPVPGNPLPTWPISATVRFNVTNIDAGTSNPYSDRTVVASFISAEPTFSGNYAVTYDFSSAGLGYLKATSRYNTTTTTGQSATAVINGHTFTFSGGVSIPATQSTQTYTVTNYGYFARDLALGTAVKVMGGEPMVLDIPAGGSINVKTVGQTALNTTYTTSQTITIPAGTTEVSLTGKGQDGNTSPQIYHPGESTYLWFITNSSYLSTSESPLYILHSNWTSSLGTPTEAGLIRSGNVSMPSGDGYNNYFVTVTSQLYTYPGYYSGGDVTTGANATAEIGGQTYTFSGGVGIPASLATYSISAYENRMAVLDVQSPDTIQFNYDLIFYKDTGTDWTVAKRFTNIGLGKTSDLTFKFSKDGNTFVLSDSTNNRLVIYNYTADWNTPTIINLGTFGITLPSTLGLGTQVAINPTGTKIALVLISSTGSHHFIVLSLSAGTWTKTMQHDFAANDYIEAVYANDDLSVLAGISDNGSYPILNLYTSNGTTLTKVQVIEPPETDKSSIVFGTSLDISSDGNTLAVSSLNHNEYSQVLSSIHIFERQTTLWQLTSSLSASDQVNGDHFGVAIDLSADAKTLVANGFSGADTNNRGAVYVFQ